MYWITGILGLALMVAPSILGYSANATAQLTSLVLGAVVVIVSVVKASVRGVSKWEYWVAGIAGVLTVLAPFVLSFSAHATALWTSIILGAVVAILASLEVFRQPQTK